MLCMKIVEGAIKSLTDRAICWGEIWKIRKKEKKKKKKKKRDKKEKKRKKRKEKNLEGRCQG